MIQGSYGTGFALESFAELLLRDFDGDSTVQARVAGLVDFPHAAGADGSDDLVGS
jgi:hypothetical protein